MSAPDEIDRLPLYREAYARSIPLAHVFAALATAVLIVPLSLGTWTIVFAVIGCAVISTLLIALRWWLRDSVIAAERMEHAFSQFRALDVQYLRRPRVERTETGIEVFARCSLSLTDDQLQTSLEKVAQRYSLRLLHFEVDNRRGHSRLSVGRESLRFEMGR